jgi:hypothetical protein
VKTTRQDCVEDFLRRMVVVGLASENSYAWNRFYHFIGLAHSYRRKWDSHDVKKMLVKYGVPADKAEMFSEVYWHGRCVLYNRDHFDRYRPQYAKWVRSGSARVT